MITFCIRYLRNHRHIWLVWLWLCCISYMCIVLFLRLVKIIQNEINNNRDAMIELREQWSYQVTETRGGGVALFALSSGRTHVFENTKKVLLKKIWSYLNDFIKKKYFRILNYGKRVNFKTLTGSAVNAQALDPFSCYRHGHFWLSSTQRPGRPRATFLFFCVTRKHTRQPFLFPDWTTMPGNLLVIREPV